ncbi:MAG: DUF885 domain-containing protein [Polyangiaceae bacterium]
MRPTLSIFSAALIVLLSSCVRPDATHDAPRLALTTPHPEHAPMNGPLDASLNALSERFLTGYFEREPVRATEAGEHRFDGKFPDLSESGDLETRRFVEHIRGELRAIDRAQLGVQARVDHQILENLLEHWIFSLEELRETEWNPVIVVGQIGDGLDPLVTRDFAPATERARSLVSRLSQIGALIDGAKPRLKHPPRVHTETAIAQVKGLISLCESGLGDLAKEAPTERANIERESKKAGDALKGYLSFLEKDLLPRSDGDFRIGRAKLIKKLRFVLDDDLDVDRLVADAKELLSITQREMVETSKELFPKLFPSEAIPALDSESARKSFVKKVLAKLAEESSTNATIVGDAEKWLADATKFVRERDLVEVPPEPCKVIEMPEYRRGVAIAYCDASGPLEQKQQTFYAISPTPSDWSAERSASFYREYNRSMLADLTVHEAMPGHFLQLMHNNRFKSKLRAVFSSGSFVEGWAVYSEWVMASHGFGGPAVRLQRQKMVLRLAVNTLLDYGVHAGNMSEAEALSLMRDEAFQEEGEAVGKWKRARLTSSQLTTYFHGFREMMLLRKAAESQPGFRERSYHDRLLSAGSPPMRHAWTLMALQRPTTSPFASTR